jgi:hypothetical protein
MLSFIFQIVDGCKCVVARIPSMISKKIMHFVMMLRDVIRDERIIKQ